MIQLNCPHCGQRNEQEFRFGGEYNTRPKQPMTATDAEWVDFVYLRDNKLGLQKEWWYHRNGCGTWFLAERHTKTNEVVETYLWEPS